MAKIKAEMTEMKDASVNYVSLVQRGANRIPFRIVKTQQPQEQNMAIDLGAIGRIFKSEAAKPTVPEVAGIVVKTSDEATLASVTQALSDAGYKVDSIQKHEDGTTLFAQGEVPAETHIVKMSDNVAIVMKGFSPYCSDLDSSSDFSEVMSTTGFYSGVNQAVDALSTCVRNATYKSDDPQAAAKEVGKSVDQFKAYLTTMIAAIPAKAFKMEKDVEAAVALVITAKAEKEPAPVVAEPAAAPVAAPAAAPATPAVAEGVVDASKIATADTADLVAKTADMVNQALSPTLLALAESLKGVTEAVTTLKADQQKISESVAESARKADNAQQAVSSTVVAASTQGDGNGEQTQVSKTDTDPRTGAFDTAFISRRR